jgi:indolepyruvate ferredoxin oxidoreductase beta subunit
MNPAETTRRPENPFSSKPRAISIAILAMGGEGGGVLADWIVDLAEHSGYCAQTTSVPGVAQRTGATIYYVEIFPDSFVKASGKEPVLALMPVPGEVDIVIASELMEAGRAIQRGLVTPNRTTLIVSTHRVYSMTEKTATNDGRVDARKLLEGCEKAAKKCVQRNFAQIASEKNSVISAVLFGALAETGALPFQREQFEEAIRRGGVGVASSLTAFTAGLQAATKDEITANTENDGAVTPGPRLASLRERIVSTFPAASRQTLFAGIVRLADYQDERYAADYLQRLEKIRELDQKYGNGSALLTECARYLALWMSYEDAIRVADLKIRSSRFERIQRETNSTPAQLVQIHEFLYPRINEIADILPRNIGGWLIKSSWPKRLVMSLTEHGRELHTTSLGGFLQLYILAGLRRWRRGSLRFAEERQKMTNWLEKVGEFAARDYFFALEFAELPHLLRGYGDTHLHGKENFEVLMAVAARLVGKSDAAAVLKKLREAALADESGQRLKTLLQEVAT